MKTLNQILVFVVFIFWGCSNDGPLEIDSQNNSLSTEDQVSFAKIDNSLKSDIDCTIIPDINFVNPRFQASVFYDSISGPDGIAVLSPKKLLVVKEFGTPGRGVFSAARCHVFSVEDAFSTIGAPFVSPDDIVINRDGAVFVADGQALTVFKMGSDGGPPQAFVTTSTTGSPSFQPFGVAIAPENFNGPNVDPGDLIIADNSKAVWAVNPNTGLAKIIAQGSVFIDGPLKPAFATDGTLFIFENNNPGSSRIVILSSNGTVTPFLTGIPAREFFAIHPRTDEIFFKNIEGEIWRIPKTGGTPQLFASNIGEYQDMVFNKHGTSLYVSVRARNQVIEISAK
ncbi:hypothetical protein IH970_14650 [candidate division KSB1 bacterium]|nr:hypothetical protein [candidate division KSB1 bacterium]